MANVDLHCGGGGRQTSLTVSGGDMVGGREGGNTRSSVVCVGISGEHLHLPVASARLTNIQNVAFGIMSLHVPGS